MNSIRETYKNHPSLNEHHLVPLDYHSVDAIPKSHEWTQSPADHPIIVVDPHTLSGTVPIIDLSDPSAESLIRPACEEWGIFQVTNHGVPARLLEELELQMGELFSLPYHRKLRALRSPKGVTGYGMPRSSKFFSKLMWFEGFTIVGSSSLEHASQLWPHQPNQRANFCCVMDEYQKEIRALTERLLGLMLQSLGLTFEDVEWFKPQTGPSRAEGLLKLNSYPRCPDPNRAMGLVPHTDSSLVTTLFQSNHTGFQVFSDGIGWIPVEPVPGALLVNLGDLMHILSNGLFKTIVHRVVPDKTHHRVSAAYFYGPQSDVKLSPSIRLTDHGRPPLYSPISWKEYLKLKAMHWNDTLEHIRDKNGALAAKEMISHEASLL